MALPYGTTGSLCPTFVPARLVGLAVKHPCANALYVRLLSVLSVPLEASVTIWEATTPVKLPTRQGPLYGLESTQRKSGISPTAPRYLAAPDRSLPPILHMRSTLPVSSCSEGSRGLFVP